MSRPAYAKLPSAWARRKPTRIEQVPIPTTEPERGAHAYLPVEEGLTMLKWRAHKSHASAALLVLFALSIISNKAQRKDGLRKTDLVQATYEEIQAVAPLSRKLVCEGLKLLHTVGAISSERYGNRSIYHLLGIDEGGQWCELPQQHLLNSFSFMHRFGPFVDQIKRPTTLHALKLYMLLLTFRNSHLNATRMSYDTIAEYTGLRREEISTAVLLLIGAQLCRMATDQEVEVRKGDRTHNRYIVMGLSAS